jgi:hypothetical protein
LIKILAINKKSEKKSENNKGENIIPNSVIQIEEVRKVVAKTSETKY